MRIDRLYISDFKNLKQFSLDIDESSWVTILLGWNGTGKSNVIEALVLIFRNLDLGEPPPFPYRIEYRCRDHKVKIDCVAIADDGIESIADTKNIAIALDGKSVTHKAFASEELVEYRPSHVFGYYSGPSNRLEEHFDQHQRNFYRALLDGVRKPLRRLFYARPVHSHFVLLAFFSTLKKHQRKFLRERLGIEGFESALFVMKEPPWYSSKPSPQARKDGDERYWWARGRVKEILGELHDIALAPMKIKRPVLEDISKRRPKQVDYRYFYINGEKKLRELAKKFNLHIDEQGNETSQTAFFKTLESTYLSKVLVEVRVRVKVRGVDGSLIFRELSEGEQQLLTVLGLLEFTKEQESLFLLDEPDTHLNPMWSIDYLLLLENVISKGDNSQILMATHDPLVLSDLTKSQVQVLNRLDDEKTRIFARPPADDPRGMGVLGILTSDMFGLTSDLGQSVLKLLNRKVVIENTVERDEELEKELEGINRELNNHGLLESFSNPFFAAYLEKNLKGFTPNEYSAEDKLRHRQMTDEILERLAAMEEQG